MLKCSLVPLNQRTDNFIPLEQRQQFLARGANYLAKATYLLAKEVGGMAPEAKQAAGVKAIALAREALAIHSRLMDGEDEELATYMVALADVLDFFNQVDDAEVIRLYEKAKNILAEMQGSLSSNVATAEKNLGITYRDRAIRALEVHDFNRAATNAQLALPRLREALRILRAVNRVDRIDDAIFCVGEVEQLLRQIERARARTAAVASSAPALAAATNAKA